MQKSSREYRTHTVQAMLQNEESTQPRKNIMDIQYVLEPQIVPAQYQLDSSDIHIRGEKAQSRYKQVQQPQEALNLYPLECMNQRQEGRIASLDSSHLIKHQHQDAVTTSSHAERMMNTAPYGDTILTAPYRAITQTLTNSISDSLEASNKASTGLSQAKKDMHAVRTSQSCDNLQAQQPIGDTFVTRPQPFSGEKIQQLSDTKNLQNLKMYTEVIQSEFLKLCCLRFRALRRLSSSFCALTQF